MYTLKCDDYILHNIDADLMVINCVCKLEVNKTGSLVFYVAPNHPYRDKIKKHTSKIVLYQNGEALFYGRVLNNDVDIDNLMCVECEGELSYLLDTIQRAKEYHLDNTSENVVKDYFIDLINIHNSQVPDDKQFFVGDVNVTDPNNYLYRISSYENTLNIINDRLISRLGGYINITRNNAGQRFLNYIKESSIKSNQTIEFGKNIIDITQTISGENIYTALIPLGAKEENNSESKVETRLTIKNLDNITDGTIVKKDDYIYDSEAVKKWGWIWKVEKWDDVTRASNLLTKAKEKLSQSIYESMCVELTAIDLHNINIDMESIKVGNQVRCISKPHNIDIWLVVKSLTVDINNPANTTFKLVPTIDSISPEDKTLTSTSDDDSKDLQNLNTTVKDYTPTKSEIDSKINDLKDWIDNNYTPRSDMSNYAKTSDINDLKDWTNNNYVPRSELDLSSYAKIADVNTAFNELANAIEGV